MSFTEVTNVSFFDRLKSSCGGFIFGIILIIVGIGLTFWNEGRAVQTAKSLKEGKGKAVSVSADKVDSNNNGKLVHVTGQAVTDEVLADDKFGVEGKFIRLERSVLMYQWVEHKKTRTEKKVGGGKRKEVTYTYKREWKDKLIDSSRFKKPEGHRNPERMPFRDKSIMAREVKLGAYELSSGLVSQIKGEQRLRLTRENWQKMSRKFKDNLQLIEESDMYYDGRSPNEPEVGDIKVYFRKVEPAVVSIVAQQDGAKLTGYKTKAGDTLLMLEMGKHSAKAMFKKAVERNKSMTWILRFVGLAALVFGFMALASPFTTLADVIPFLGDIVGAGTALFAFLIGFAIWLVIMSVAWLFFRPVLGVLMLAVAIGAIVGLVVVSKKKKQLQGGEPSGEAGETPGGF